jgi:hypothetical protein
MAVDDPLHPQILQGLPDGALAGLKMLGQLVFRGQPVPRTVLPRPDLREQVFLDLRVDGAKGIHGSENFIIINIILILFMKYRELCQQENTLARLPFGDRLGRRKPPRPCLSSDFPKVKGGQENKAPG